jgi:hypothetical protein
MLDGTPTLRLNEFMLASVDAGKIPLELPSNEKAQSPMPKPTELVFELDRKAMEAVEKSKKGFEQEMALQQLKVSKAKTSLIRWSNSQDMERTKSKSTKHHLMLGLNSSSNSHFTEQKDDRG